MFYFFLHSEVDLAFLEIFFYCNLVCHFKRCFLYKDSSIWNVEHLDKELKFNTFSSKERENGPSQWKYLLRAAWKPWCSGVNFSQALDRHDRTSHFASLTWWWESQIPCKWSKPMQCTEADKAFTFTTHRPVSYNRVWWCCLSSCDNCTELIPGIWVFSHKVNPHTQVLLLPLLCVPSFLSP